MNNFNITRACYDSLLMSSKDLLLKDDNLKLISKKENSHKGKIYTLSKIGNGLILSGSQDKLVKIW